MGGSYWSGHDGFVFGAAVAIAVVWSLVAWSLMPLAILVAVPVAYAAFLLFVGVPLYGLGRVLSWAWSKVRPTWHRVWSGRAGDVLAYALGLGVWALIGWWLLLSPAGLL